MILTHYPVGPYLIDSNAFAGIYATRAMHLAATLIPQVDGVEPHYVKELFFFLMDQSMDTRSNIDTPGIVADFFIDTTSVIERKVQAFDQYVSQGYEGQFARKVVEARDGRHGMHAEASYAEPFLFSRSVTHDALPVPPRVLDSTYVANNLPGDRLLASASRRRRRPRPTGSVAAMGPRRQPDDRRLARLLLHRAGHAGRSPDGRRALALWQWGYAEHHQPAFRVRDRAPGDSSLLLEAGRRTASRASRPTATSGSITTASGSSGRSMATTTRSTSCHRTRSSSARAT